MNQSEFLSNLKVFEGYANYMYLDTKGYVTIGCGLLLTHETMALRLKPFSNKLTGKMATDDEIKKEFLHVKNKLSKGKTLNYYGENTTLRANEGILNGELQKRIEAAKRIAMQYYPKFNESPAELQFALIDMAFNMGNNINKFVQFKKALEKKDYATAAKESFRRDVQASRNKFTADLIASIPANNQFILP